MNGLVALALLTDFFPLLRALAANRRSTARFAILWAIAALAFWLVAASADSAPAAYAALALSGCAGVMVLGARRPGAGPWNFVVAGLLAVLLLPLATGLGTLRLETAHIFFLGTTLAAVVLNYLPTRPGPAAIAAGAASGIELARLAGVAVEAEMLAFGRLLLALSPWLAWLLVSWRRPVSELDRTWSGFRDRFGFLWAERIRQQFNRSAASAGRNERLGWFGISPQPTEADELLRLLKALLKRFEASTTDAAQPID
jgi:hypothetical protein